jgi:hypothetical protein
MTMHDASQQFDYSPLPGGHPAGEMHLPKMVIHVGLMPGQTVSWRVIANAEIRAHGSRVWLTRIFSPYDYWMQPGDVVRVARGERIWLGTDSSVPAEVTLTSEYGERRRLFSRWSARWLELAFNILSPRFL